MKNKREDTRSQELAASRRRFLTTSAALGSSVVGVMASACNRSAESGAAGSAAPKHQVLAASKKDAHVAPGQLDQYYGFWSGGQSGEIRILGVPSMRELKRIAVFNRDSATGWGATDYSKRLLGGKASGDTHHVHLSYTDGTYDGRWVFVNDKASARLARVDIESMEVDRIVEIPNSQGTHGIFPQRHKTGLVLCNAEFLTPQPNDGTDLEDPKQYAAMHTAVDGESMEVRWQVMVEGNLDLCATDYEGTYSFATSYNTEQAVTLEGMMAAERDCLYVFNLPAIQQAIDAGKGQRVGSSTVPVLDARGADGPYVIRVPVPKNPHGVNIDPTGKYAICSGKLSPTASVVDISKLDDAFAGKIKPRDCVVAEPEVGLGPLHTAFDGRGNAYTSIFIDSAVTKWNIAKAIESFANPEAGIDPVIEKLDVHYQIGHINASMSETKEADGQWLIALCKFSKDRFLGVGPLHPENDQLIDISGEKMELVHDGPTYPEPHDAVIVTRSKIHPKQIQPRKIERFKLYEAWAKEDGVELNKANEVIRKGRTVRVYMTSMAPKFGMTEFRVKAGDRVQVILSNQDNVEDLSHGFCMSGHDVNFVVNSQDTNSMTFDVPKPGVYWYYCPWFCHALHLEMCGRMIVEA